MVDGATRPKRRKIKIKKDNAVAPKKKRIKRKPSQSPELEGIPKRRKKKVADPSVKIDDTEVADINEEISFDISQHIPTADEIANFGADKREGFSLDSMLDNARKSMGSVFEGLTNDNKTFGSKMDNILSLQMLALAPTIQNLDDTMYDERKAHAAVKLNDTINHLKNSLVQKQQFELKEEIDLHHPKLQKAFAFLTEAFFYVLTEVGIDPSTKALIVNALSLKMMGFEDELTKRFKGIAFSLLEQVENPLLESLPSVKQMETIQSKDIEQKRVEASKGDDFQEDVIEVTIPERK